MKPTRRNYSFREKQRLIQRFCLDGVSPETLEAEHGLGEGTLRVWARELFDRFENMASPAEEGGESEDDTTTPPAPANQTPPPLLSPVFAQLATPQSVFPVEASNAIADATPDAPPPLGRSDGAMQTLGEGAPPRSDSAGLITDLSAEVVDLRLGSLDAWISRVLRAIGEAANADRCYLFLLDAASQTLDNTHEWCAPEVVSRKEGLEGLPIEIVPWWMGQLDRLDTFAIAWEEDALPPGAAEEIGILRPRDARFIAATSLAYGDTAVGFLGFDRVRKDLPWNQAELRLLETTGDILAGAIQRHRTEEALEISRASFHNIVQRSADGILVTDTEGAILYVNAAAERLFGRDAAEMTGDSFRQEFVEGELLEIDIFLESGGIGVGEVHGVETEWQGRQARLLLIRDISERKRTEQHSREFAELGQRLNEAAAPREAAEIIFDLADRLLGWDSSFLVLHSESDDSIASLLGMDVVDGRRQEVSLGHVTRPGPNVRRALDEGAFLVHREDRSKPGDVLSFGDRQRLSASMLFVPVHNRQKVIGVLSIQSYVHGMYDERDLATLQSLGDHCGGTLDRLRAEEALRHSEERYRRLFDSARDAIFVHPFDENFEGLPFIEVNEIACQRFGYTREEFLTLTSADIDEAGHWPEKDLIFDKLKTEGFALFERRHVRRDGTSIPVEINAHRFELRGKSLMLSIARDITERKRTEAALVQSNRRLGSIAQLTATLISAEPFHSLAQALARQVRDVFESDACAVRYLEGDELVLLAAVGVPEDKLPERIETGWGLSKKIMETRRPFAVSNVKTDPYTGPIWANLRNPFEFRSYAGAPLIMEGKVIGLLGVYTTEQNRVFSEADLDHLQIVADNIAVAIVNDRLYRETLAQKERLEASEESLRTSNALLREIQLSHTAVLRSTPHGLCMTGPDWTLHYANPALPRLFGIEETDTEELVGQPFAALFSSPSDFEDLRQCVRTTVPRKGIVSREVRMKRRDGTLFWCDVSIVRHDPTQTVSGYVATLTDITERKQARDKILEQLTRMTALRMVETAITETLDLRVTLNIILDQVLTQLEVDAAVVLLFNPTLGFLEYAAGRGFRTDIAQNTRLRLGEGMAGQAALDRKTVHIANMAREEHPATVSLVMQPEGFVAYVAVPLLAKAEIQGVLELYHRSPLDPETPWFDFLESLGLQAAIAIDNAALFEHLQQRNLEINVAYNKTLEGLSRALELRDQETEGHSQRVADTTVRLARKLGVTGEDLVHIRRGALLHDIGKIAIPDHILLNPGPLSDEEWVVMKRHPLLAHEILHPIAYLRTALDIPLHHHEHWDGSGYPHGLEGETIPLAARIFTVVDVYDALTSQRPYRQPWEHRKAIDYIRQQAGRLFDPQVVDTFMELVAASPDSPLIH